MSVLFVVLLYTVQATYTDMGMSVLLLLYTHYTLYKQRTQTRHFEKGDLKQPFIYPGIHCFRLL